MRTNKQARKAKQRKATQTSNAIKQSKQITQNEIKQGKAKQATQATQGNAKERIATAKPRKAKNREATQNQPTKASNHDFSPSLPLALWGWPGGMRGAIE